ncbi:MAG: fimbrillin family protein, partial [Phocaeicola sp.]|nr:fimbrillin family protein [Phocaeicola sp.]
IMSKKIKLAGMVAMLSMTFVSCSNDELKEAYQGEKITFTTKVGASRAQVINGVADLESFRVHAETDPKGETPFLDHELATEVSGDNSTGIYKLEKEIMWPDKATEIEFWAYGPEGVGQPTHDGGALHFSNFSPDKDPSKQKDLVVAYTKSKKTSGAVPLMFHHALSQVEVRAKCGDKNKHVKIKSAWIANLNSKGNLWYDSNASANNYMSWRFDSNPSKQLYGESFSDAIQLSDTYQGLLAEYGDENKTKKRGNSLMMLPQDIVALDGSVNNNGVYIVMLCRIESHHSGAYVDHNAEDAFVQDADDSSYHHHQLYPQPENGGYDEDAYGYTCVPITAPEGAWKPGKKYIYKLDFFCNGSGGGILPPTEPELPEGGQETPGIVPGHPVVQEPISFTVEVEGWTEADDVEQPSM